MVLIRQILRRNLLSNVTIAKNIVTGSLANHRNYCGVGIQRAAIILAHNFDEIEAACVINLLRRSGVDIISVGLDSKDPVHGITKAKFQPTTSLEEAFAGDKVFDAVILTGSMAAVELQKKNQRLGGILAKHEDSCKIVAAIGTAPLLLKHFKLFYEKQITSYPTVKSELEKDYEYCDEDVVNDCKLITSRGPATAHLFALTICCELAGPEKAKHVAKLTLFPSC